MRGSKRRRALVALAIIGGLVVGTGGTGPAGAGPSRPDAPAATGRAAAPEAPEAPAQVTPQRRTVRYGPYTIQPGATNPDGTHGHATSGNQFAMNVEKPCTNCYITGMRPNLTRADGTTAGHSNRLMLHHMVLFNQDTGRTDATCPTGLGSLGQRFFASGDERTVTAFPDNYGYRVGANARWNLIWELASMSTVPETVYYTVEYTFVPASTPGMRDVEPVWFDVDQCGDSHVSIPAGPSSQTWTWNVNRPGNMLTVGGHVHDHGINLEVRNVTTNQVICDSRAGYGETPLYVDHHGEEHISSMSTCGGPGRPPVATNLQAGNQIRITSRYDAPAPVPDAMGIAIAYMARDGGGTASCVTAANSAHVAAGRATAWWVFAFAKGSNQFIGLTSQSTSLREGSAGTWSMVAGC